MAWIQHQFICCKCVLCWESFLLHPNRYLTVARQREILSHQICLFFLCKAQQKVYTKILQTSALIGPFGFPFKHHFMGRRTQLPETARQDLWTGKDTGNQWVKHPASCVMTVGWKTEKNASDHGSVLHPEPVMGKSEPLTEKTRLSFHLSLFQGFRISRDLHKLSPSLSV